MTRMTVRLFILGLLLAQGTARAQTADTIAPPPLVHAAGPFSALQVTGPPPVDGRAWIAVDVETGPAPRTIRVPNRRFSLTLLDPGTDTGDFERYRLLFQCEPAAAVRIDVVPTGWVYVTPDGRYVLTEPLYVLDVDGWKQYALYDALGIPNHTSIDAISRDGKRLLISRRDCVIDCPDAPVEHYELTLPQVRPAPSAHIRCARSDAHHLLAAREAARTSSPRLQTSRIPARPDRRRARVARASSTLAASSSGAEVAPGSHR